jgi:hypothetical protein
MLSKELGATPSKTEHMFIATGIKSHSVAIRGTGQLFKFIHYDLASIDSTNNPLIYQDTFDNFYRAWQR